MDGWANGWMGGQMGGWVGRCRCRYIGICLPSYVHVSKDDSSTSI